MSRLPGRLSSGRPVFAGLAGALATLLVVTILFVVFSVWIYKGAGPRARQGQATTVVVRHGAGLAEIGADLQRAGAVRSAPLFMAAAQQPDHQRQRHRPGQQEGAGPEPRYQAAGEQRQQQHQRQHRAPPLLHRVETEGEEADLVADIGPARAGDLAACAGRTRPYCVQHRPVQHRRQHPGKQRQAGDGDDRVPRRADEGAKGRRHRAPRRSIRLYQRFIMPEVPSVSTR